MTHDPYTKTIRSLKGMSTEDLIRVKNFISGLVAQGPSSADRVVTSLNHDDWLIMGIAEYIRNAGMPPVGVEAMIQSAQYTTFKTKSGPVRHYLARAGGKNVQRALLRVGLKLMHKRMTELRIAVSYVTFMTWIHRLPGSINREFPGYMESGFLPLIIRGETTNVRPEQSERIVQRKRNPPARE